MPRLPPDWAETTDARGRKYYYNAQTQESSWTLPPGTIEDPPVVTSPPPKPTGPPGPPPMPGGGPPPMPGGGPPPMPGGGPPPIPGGGPPPRIGGPPPLSINPSTTSSTQPPPSPANRGPPPMHPGVVPPSPVNKTGPPPMFPIPPSPANKSGPPPMFPSTTSLTPQPSLQQQSSTSSQTQQQQGPPMPISGPPMVSGLPPHLSGAPIATRQPSGSVSGPPPMRPPGMSVSGPPPMMGGNAPPPPMTRNPSASISGRPPGMSVSGPPPMRPPGMSVSGLPPQLPPTQPLPSQPPNNNLPLPYPWKETSAANGKIYYYNTITNETSWVRPTSEAPNNVPAFVGGTPPQKPTTMFTTPADNNNNNMNNNTYSNNNSYGNNNNMNNSSLPMVGDAPKQFIKEYSGNISLRTGVFKSWDLRYLTIKSQSQIVIYENDQMKKERVKVNASFVICVPINRGDSRNVIVLHEFVKQQPNNDSDLKLAKNQHYIDCGSNELREQILTILHDQGAIIRRPLWETSCTINKEASKFITIFPHQLEIYKKVVDDEPDVILPFTNKTFFQTQPSQFPLLYEDGKLYGPVGPQTFLIAEHCNEDATLYYITTHFSTNPNQPTTDTYEVLLKRTKDAISTKQTKVEPSSLCEGYLYKASTNLQRWSRRYFILRRDSLSYYKMRGDEKSVGEVALPPGFEVDLHPTNVQYPHPLFVAESGDEGTRQYLMCALNDSEYETWSNALQSLQQQKQVKKVENSLKEGYLYICGLKQKPARKYAVVNTTDISLYHSRKDNTPAQTIQLPKGCYIAEGSLPGDDIVHGTHQKVHMLSVTNPTTNVEYFLGFSQALEREQWSAVLKGIAGDAVAKSHPESYKEGYMYKSKKKGSLGNLKYCVVTPLSIFYSDKKELDVLSTDPVVQKRVKKFMHTGDGIIDEDLTTIPGYKGLGIPSTGDESGGEMIYLYFSDDNEFNLTKIAITQALAAVDWRRDSNSIFEGYVWKSNASGKSWTYRYAILTTDALTFYKKKFDRDIAGQMPLQSCTYNKISNNDNLDKNNPDRVAIDNFTSNFKHKDKHDFIIIGIQPPTHDPKAKKIWIGSFLATNSLQWNEVFSELGSIGKQQHPGSIKEGYLCIGGSSPANRKYVSLYKDRIDLFPSRLDLHMQGSIPLASGFDVLYKDNQLFISKSSNAEPQHHNYNIFTNAVGGEILSNWLDAFQQAYNSNTPPPSTSVRVQVYAQVSYNKAPQSFKYLVILQDKIALFNSRSLCYPTPQSTEPDLRNAESTTAYTSSTLEQLSLGPQKLQIKIGHDVYVIDFRTDYEEKAVVQELQSITTGTSQSLTATDTSSSTSSSMKFQPPASPRVSMAALPQFDRVGSRQAAFTMSIGLPPPPTLLEEAPPPPMFLDEDEDPPPPPPPDFDDDDNFAPPVPTESMFTFPTPQQQTTTITPQQQVPATTGGTRAMPLFDDDDDDDIPDFIKEKRRQQAAAAQQPQSTPAPTSTFTAPATTTTTTASTGFKAPQRSTDPPKQGSGLGLDFDFSFDLPPAPAFDLPPPTEADLEPVKPLQPKADESASVRRPLFGQNRTTPVTTTPAPEPINPKYQPVDFDDDDDDLPPPGGK